MELTNNQKDAIYNHTNPMLVSASAGSGKTFAMVERALSILSNGEANLKELLIVTFTNASALEMKQRLYDGLKNSNNPNLKNQLDDFSVADISSIDSFCQKVIKKYFFEINVSPNFSVIDEVEANFLKNSALTKTFQSLQKQKNTDFKLLVESLAQKRSLNSLSEHILNISNYANTLPDKDYLYQELISKTYDDNLENNPCVAYLIQNFDKFILDVVSNLNELKFEAVDDEAIFNQYIDETLRILDNFLNVPLISKITGFNTLIDFYKMPDRRSFKLQSQKDFRDKLLNIFNSIKEEAKKYNKYFENGEIQKIKKILKKSQEFVKNFINIVILFEENYEKLKKEKFLLDFADLERKTFEILKNEEILESISKNYKFVFIDEFQDTNRLQFSILKAVSKYATPFYVGDPKQSIYAFRNSTPEILIDTLKEYKLDSEHKKAINFVENFRSDKWILEFVNFVFSQIMTVESVDIDYLNDGKFNTEKSISFSNPNMPSVTIGIMNKTSKKEKIVKNEVYSLLKAQKNIENERKITDYTDLIVWYIKSFFEKDVKIFDKELNCDRKVCYSDFVILLRNRASFENVENKLSQHKIPVSANLSINLLDCLEVQVLHNFLAVISNSFDDYALTNFLLSPIGGLKEADLIQIRTKFPQEEYFYSACYKYLRIDDALSIKLKKCFNILDVYRVKIQAQKISDILDCTINEFGLENLWLSLPAGKDRVNKVRLFINVLKNKSFNSSLSDYLQFTEIYKDAFEVNYSTTSTDNCIKLMTIHNSKGLEFPITIIGDAGKEFKCAKTNTKPVMIHSKFGVAIDVYDVNERIKTQTLIKDAISNFKKESELKEEMRLLYVGLTRAKYFLGVFGNYNMESASKDILNKGKNPKTYLDWIIFACSKNINFESRKEQSITQNAVFQIFDSEQDEKENAANEIKFLPKQENKDFVKKLADSYAYTYPYSASTNINIKNSVSKLLSSLNSEQEIKSERENFLTPLSYNNTLEEASARGIAYHKVMEQIDFQNNNFSKQLEKIHFNLPTQILNLVDTNLIEKCFYSVKEKIDYESKIYKEHKFMLYIPYNEIFKKSAVSDKILVQGIIDIFIETDDKIILIDYKTNAIKNEEKLRDKYQLQLDLYKLALEIQYKKPVETFIYSFSISKMIKM